VKFRKILRKMRSSVHLLHVIDFNDSMFKSGSFSSPFHVVDLETEERKQRLIQAGRTLSSQLTKFKVDPVIRFGDPATEILDELSSNKYDFAIMKVKKGTLGTRFFDSVAYKVIRQSIVPVITIKTKF
jgi:nucleotide-binding universal stress UspA family protein